DHRRIELHPHHFDMSAGFGTNLFVSGIIEVTAGVSRRHFRHAAQIFHDRLCTPEAPATQDDAIYTISGTHYISPRLTITAGPKPGRIDIRGRVGPRPAKKGSNWPRRLRHADLPALALAWGPGPTCPGCLP